MFQTQLFEFVDDLNNYLELKGSKNIESESSTYKFQDTSNLASTSSFLQKNTNLYSKELPKDWERMINNKMMSDVTIYVKNEEKICAHTLVFYARCSQILADITQNNETGGGIIFWNCVSYDPAIAFLSYLYCGDVKRIVNLQEHLPDVKYLAVKYNITELLNIFKTISNDHNIDRNRQSFEEQKQNIKETSTYSISKCSLQTEDTCETQTRFYRFEKSSENELNLENPRHIQDTHKNSLTVPKSPDLFLDQIDMESDDENSRSSSNNAAEAKSDLDFLASMLCKSTPTSVSTMRTKETENCAVDISPRVSCESDAFNLHCTPDREVKCHAKRYFEDDNSSNECRSDFKKVCIEGELGRESNGIIETESYSDLVDLTQTSSDVDENEDDICSRDNEDSSTEQVIIPKFSWQYVDRDKLENGGPENLDKILNEKEKLSESELLAGSKSDSPDKIIDYKTEDTSKVNISSIEDLNAELDLFGYDEYDHFYNNDLSDSSPVQSPEISPPVTENKSENQLSNTSSDENEMGHLSQNAKRAHENIKKSPSLKENRQGQIFKSPCVPNTKQNIQPELPNLLVALLDDSFSENLANSSLIQQSISSYNDMVQSEKIFSPNVQCGSGKMKQFDTPEESEQQNSTPDNSRLNHSPNVTPMPDYSTPENSKLNHSPNVTPMPDYSAMKTPVLKVRYFVYKLFELLEYHLTVNIKM